MPYRSGLNTDVRLELHRTIDSFTMSPESFTDMVFDEVKKMAMADCLLVPDRLEPKKKNLSERSVQVDLDEGFRKEKAIEGKEFRKTYVFDCAISTLTPSQREKLWDMHYTESGSIPLRLYLRMPEFDISTTQIILKGPGIWRAKLDPTACSVQAIFNAWEVAFDEALELAEKAKTQSRNNDLTTLDPSLVSAAENP